MKKSEAAPGRLLSWVALLAGLGVSVAANVASARADMGPRLTSAVAPLLVVAGAGMLERVPAGRAHWWQRAILYTGLPFVVFAAFATSYQHQHRLLLEYGNDTLSATLLPLAVDATVTMASVCLSIIAALHPANDTYATADTTRDIAADTTPVHVATSPQVTPDIMTDTAADTAAVATPAVPPAPKPRATMPRRQARYDATLAKAEEVMRELDGGDQADIINEIARREKCSRRTAERHYGKVRERQAVAAASVDESDIAQLTLA